MPTYLSAFRQPSNTWANLIARPEDRAETLAPMIESIGGKLLGYWYAFGDIDGYALIEAPDDVAVASLLVKVAASGGISVSTTKLLSTAEMVDALSRAGGVSYTPPGG